MNKLIGNIFIASPKITGKLKNKFIICCEEVNNQIIAVVLNEKLQIKTNFNKELNWGGTIMSDEIIVIHSSKYSFHSTVQVTKKLSISPYLELLDYLDQGYNISEYSVYAGFCSLDKIQFEEDIAQDKWLINLDKEIEDKVLKNEDISIKNNIQNQILINNLFCNNKTNLA